MSFAVCCADRLVYPTPQRVQRFFFPLEDVQRIIRTSKEPHITLGIYTHAVGEDSLAVAG
jgi:hypothetical protein